MTDFPEMDPRKLTVGEKRDVYEKAVHKIPKEFLYQIGMSVVLYGTLEDREADLLSLILKEEVNRSVSPEIKKARRRAAQLLYDEHGYDSNLFIMYMRYYSSFRDEKITVKLKDGRNVGTKEYRPMVNIWRRVVETDKENDPPVTIIQSRDILTGESEAEAKTPPVNGSDDVGAKTSSVNGSDGVGAKTSSVNGSDGVGAKRNPLAHSVLRIKLIPVDDDHTNLDIHTYLYHPRSNSDLDWGSAWIEAFDATLICQDLIEASFDLEQELVKYGYVK